MSAYDTHAPVADSPSLLLLASVHSEEVCEDVFLFESKENKQCIIIMLTVMLLNKIGQQK